MGAMEIVLFPLVSAVRHAYNAWRRKENGDCNRFIRIYKMKPKAPKAVTFRNGGERKEGRIHPTAVSLTRYKKFTSIGDNETARTGYPSSCASLGTVGQSGSY